QDRFATQAGANAQQCVDADALALTELVEHGVLPRFRQTGETVPDLGLLGVIGGELSPSAIGLATHEDVLLKDVGTGPRASGSRCRELARAAGLSSRRPRPARRDPRRRSGREPRRP